MVYTILYQFGDGLYHPILVICWMIHSWVYFWYRHFSTVFSCANVHFPSACAEFRLMLVEWSGALPFFSVCVSACLFFTIEPHFRYSNISNYQVRMFAAPNPNFSSYKTWLLVYLPLWKIYAFVSCDYCSILFPIIIWKVIKFQSPPSRNRHVWGSKTAMFRSKSHETNLILHHGHQGLQVGHGSLLRVRKPLGNDAPTNKSNKIIGISGGSRADWSWIYMNLW